MSFRDFLSTMTPRTRIVFIAELIVGILIVVGVALVWWIKVPIVDAPSDGLATYISSPLQVTFKYPATWRIDPGYSGIPGIERYSDGNGPFFQLDAAGSFDAKYPGVIKSIDTVVRDLAYHKLKPYGSKPVIEKATINGGLARFIVPSSDQMVDMRNQAALIVVYPEAIMLGTTSYRYFVLYADSDNIRQIGDTIQFMNTK